MSPAKCFDSRVEEVIQVSNILQILMNMSKNLIIEIWNQLEKPLAKHDCTLHAIRLYETENNYVDYYGGE